MVVKKNLLDDNVTLTIITLTRTIFHITTYGKRIENNTSSKKFNNKLVLTLTYKFFTIIINFTKH